MSRTAPNIHHIGFLFRKKKLHIVRPCVVYLIAVSVLITATRTNGATIVLTPSADTSLFEHRPDYNLGRAELASGQLGSNVEYARSRALIRFPTEDIPKNVILTSAVLKLIVSRAPLDLDPSMFALHRMLRPWTEGLGGFASTSGNPAQSGETTWNAQFYPTNLWSAPGAAAPIDFSSQISSATFINGLGTNLFTNLLADVRYWLDHDDQNFGWILISEEEETSPFSAQRFYSREGGPTKAPTLILDYIPIPTIELTEVIENHFYFSFVAQPGQAFFVQFNDSLNTNNWTTFTNIPPSSATQTVVVTDEVSGSKRYYRVGF